MIDERAPFSVTLSGPDSRGLMALISDILDGKDCELADTRIARLVGEACGIMVVYAPRGTTSDELSHAFDPLRELGIRIQVREPPDDGWPSVRTPFTKEYMVSYEGADEPEITRELSHALSEAGCSFTDISIDSALGERTNAYVLVCSVVAPLEREEIEAIVARVSETCGVDLSVIPADMDDITLNG